MRIYGRSKSLIEKHAAETASAADQVSFLLTRTLRNRPDNENSIRGMYGN